MSARTVFHRPGSEQNGHAAATLRAVNDHATALLAPMPLAARASIGRGAAAVMAVLVAVGGAFAANADDVPLAPWLLWTAVIAVIGLYLVVALAPWTDWFGSTGQEALLIAAVVVPASGVVAAFGVGDPGDSIAVMMLAAVAVASALTLRLRLHLVGTVGMLAMTAAVGVANGQLDRIDYELVVILTVALLGGLASSVLGRTLAANRRRDHEAEAANQALLAVVDAARDATSADTQDVLDRIVEATSRLRSDTAGIYVLRPDGRLQYGATYEIPDHLRDEVFEPEEGLAGQVFATGDLVITNDYQTFMAGMGEYREIGLRAAVGAPVRIDGEIVGVLVAGRFTPGGYDDAAVAAFRLLADHAGRALALSHAIDADRRLLTRLRSLHALQEDFVATVSHELRTPLTVIDGLAETLEHRASDLGPDHTATIVSRLRANTTALTTIVTTLLEAARLDRGLVELEEQPIDLWGLVEGCVARLSPLLGSHDVKLDLDDVAVQGDGDLLERVIDNLLTNAQRHTPPGTSVLVESRVVDGDCVVTIADDGPGIPPDELEVITERFTRGGDHHTRTTRGLGLGLALADQILRLHGTRLQVESPGRGARFTFRLRLAAGTGVDLADEAGSDSR